MTFKLNSFFASYNSSIFNQSAFGEEWSRGFLDIYDKFKALGIPGYDAGYRLGSEDALSGKPMAITEDISGDIKCITDDNISAHTKGEKYAYDLYYYSKDHGYSKGYIKGYNDTIADTKGDKQCTE